MEATKDRIYAKTNSLTKTIVIGINLVAKQRNIPM